MASPLQLTRELILLYTGAKSVRICGQARTIEPKTAHFLKLMGVTRTAAEERVEAAKLLLLGGFTGIKTAKVLGYSHPFNLYRAFKQVTGQTITEFLSQHQ